MCNWVTVGDNLATNMGELRALVGVEPVIDSRYPNPADWPDDSCLCPCDLEATAERASMVLGRDEAMNYTMTPKAKE